MRNIMNNTFTRNYYLCRRVKDIPICLTDSKKGKPAFKGKFFYVEIQNNKCIKWLRKKRKVINGIANIVAISTTLEEKKLTPRIHTILINHKSSDIGICVDKAIPLCKNNKNEEVLLDFEKNLKKLISKWSIYRVPYDEYPGVDSFLLEAKVLNNLGTLNNKILLLDIDLKCISYNFAIHYAASIIEKRINALVSTTE